MVASEPLADEPGTDLGADLVGVVLAAGAGRRLAPLTRLRPKPLCPVGNVPLLDLALERLRSAGIARVAVNVHHGRAAMEAHLAERPVHVSIEEREALGTAGALGHLRSWIAGAGTVVVNADAWCPGSLRPLVEGWDGERVRLLLVGEDDLTPGSRVAGALMPWRDVAALPASPAGLYEHSWAAAQRDGRLEVVRHDGPFVDCGTPRDYLEANLRAVGQGALVDPSATVTGAVERSAVGAGAVVAGTVRRSVLWSGAEVRAGEHLEGAVRTGSLTLLVR